MDGYIIFACIICFYIGFLLGRNKDFCKNHLHLRDENFTVTAKDVNEENIIWVKDNSDDDSSETDIKTI